MTTSLAFLLGMTVGAGAGVMTGRHLAGSVSQLTSGRGRLSYVFGLVGRNGLLAAVLVGSIALGPWIWTGVAAGYLAGFVAAVLQGVRRLKAAEHRRGV